MIPVRNVWYMLSYAFRTLSQSEYKSIAAESFENTGDLFAEILFLGTQSLLKRGLQNQYQTHKEAISALKGKIRIGDSIKSRSIVNKELVCDYDELNQNTQCNRILKTTIEWLIKADINLQRKRKLSRLLPYFQQVDTLEIKRINWNIHYDRNSQIYQMLMGICDLAIHGLIQTQQNGQLMVMDFLDDQQMYHLYEKFLLAFFRKECPGIKANAEQIPWAVFGNSSYLPVMQSDITLRSGKCVLIIDAKYYTQIMQKSFETQTIHSANLYQIFTYVKNMEMDMGNGFSVSGLLLYAGTNEEIQPNEVYEICGSRIEVRTLNLDTEFTDIKENLLKIAESMKQYM